MQRLMRVHALGNIIDGALKGKSSSLYKMGNLLEKAAKIIFIEEYISL